MTAYHLEINVGIMEKWNIGREKLDAPSNIPSFQSSKNTISTLKH